jgi:shikimate kinase
MATVDQDIQSGFTLTQMSVWYRKMAKAQGKRANMVRRSKTARILDKLGSRSIVLVGMMGCGKSAIGAMLAKKLGIGFKDADAEIERAAGRSVADIFSGYGETEFRRLEQKVISRLLSEGPMVLALGGGAFMNETTREAIAQDGFSVWFNVDIDTLHERVMRKPGKRPLLASGNPRETLQNLMHQREPVYALADLKVQSVPGTKTHMRDHVMAEIDKHLTGENGKHDA